MTSLRSMRKNIWRGLLSAADQEIRDGLDFYPGAHGLCRFFAQLFPRLGLCSCHVAGIYAALSPMNTWDTNVANVLDVLRYQSFLVPRGLDLPGAAQHPRVNTTDINKHKALLIADGHHPLSVLRGNKVCAFYRAIADPYDTSPIPVDRHLINLALGTVPDKATQSAYANDRALYARIEKAYAELGKREGLGNRLASIAWFVQRRIERTGQIPLLHPLSPVCCGGPMWSHGKRPRRFYCPRCRSTDRGEVCTRLIRTATGWELREAATDGLKVWEDGNGRKCVTVPSQHPYGNGKGYQRLARFILSEELGRPLRPDEHVHHLDGNLRNDRLENLSVVSVQYHGRIHASAVFVARNTGGRFRELNENDDVTLIGWPRDGSILGTQARRN